MKTVATVVLVVGLMSPSIAAQSDDRWYQKAWHTLRDPAASTWYGGIWKTWSDTTSQGDTSLLVPINTYHMRFAYRPDQIERYTEWPLGVGLGRTQVGDTTSRMVFGMTMQDSHGTMEYEVGYLWLRNRYPITGNRDFHLGFGYTLNVLIREQFHYRPFPIVFPVASIGYKRLTVGTTYVPGSKGYGNVLVTGAHLSF